MKRGAPTAMSLWPITLGTFILLFGDGGSFGALCGQVLLAAGRADPIDRDLVGTWATSGIDPLSQIYGTFTAFAYLIYPMQFIVERSPLGLIGFRTLCWALLVLHPILLVVIGLDLHYWRADALRFLFLTAPVSAVGTLFLPAMLQRLRRMPFLDPNEAASAMPQPLIGGAGRRTVGRLLGAGGALLLVAAPLRAAVPLALAGRAMAGRRRPPAPVPGHASFAEPRAFLAAGLLCVPPLLVLDVLAGGTYFALRGSDTVEGLLHTLSAAATLAIVPIVFVLFPIMLMLPLMLSLPERSRLGLALYRSLGVVLLVIYAGLLFFFGVLGFGLDLHGWTITIAPPAYALLRPVAWGLLASLPLPVLLTLSMVRVPAGLRATAGD